jgi:hypothetical protein
MGDRHDQTQTLLLDRRRALAHQMADDSAVRTVAFAAAFKETYGRLTTSKDADRRTVQVEGEATAARARTPATESASLLPSRISSRLSTRTPVGESLASPMRLPTPKAHLPHHVFASSRSGSIVTSTSAPFLPMPTRTSAACAYTSARSNSVATLGRYTSAQLRRAALKEAARLINEPILVPPPFAPLLSPPAASIAAAAASPRGAHPSARLGSPPSTKRFLAPDRIRSRVPANSILNRAPSIASSRRALPAVSDQWIHPTPSPGLLTRLSIPSNAQVDGAWRRVECRAERLMRQRLQTRG